MDPVIEKAFEERNRIIRRLARRKHADFGLRYFSIKEATGRDDAVWQPFQVDVMNHTSMFYSMNKSRQIGASFTVSAFALFDLLLKPGADTVITTSINLEEAKEKVIYVKRWWEARASDPENIPTDAEFNGQGGWIGDQGNRIKRWPEIVQASSFQITWENGARFISHPSRPPRGKRASVINDEFAHVQQAADIYRASIPMITRGGGENWYMQLSTPAGAMGRFWEIHTNTKDFPDYERRDYGWWEIFDLCAKENVLAARRAFLEGMDHKEMIRKFGTRMAYVLHNATYEDDWFQEYCLQFLDSAYSFLPWELIRSCHPPYYLPNLDAAEAGDDYIEDQDPAEIEKLLERSYIAYTARTWEDGLEIIRKLREHIDCGDIEDDLIAGYDCGRRKDNAEFCIIGVRGGLIKQRAVITMPRTRFEDQRKLIKAAMDTLPIRRAIFDQGGMGEDIAEWAVKHFGMRIISVQYSNETKSQWANSLKQSMEGRILTIIPDRDQDQQLHSVQRKATQVGLIQYVVVEERTLTMAGGQKAVHHADKFWALATAVAVAVEWIKGAGGIPTVAGESRTAPKLGAAVASKGFRSFADRASSRLTKSAFAAVKRSGNEP